MATNLFVSLYFTVLLIEIKGLEYPLLSSSACYGVDLPCTSHHLQCATGSVISIISAYYGYKQQCETAITCSKCCWYTEGDCLIEYNPKHYQLLFKSCSLQNECMYRAPWVASTMCSRYQQILTPSVYSYITYRCTEVIGMGNVNDAIPAITPVKGEWNSKNKEPDEKSLSDDTTRILEEERVDTDTGIGLGSVLVSIICSVLLVFLLVIIAVLFKLGYCYRICQKLKKQTEGRKNTDETPEYYECETISESVPDVISNSLYSQPYDRPSTSHVSQLGALYAIPMKKNKRKQDVQRYPPSKGELNTKTSGKLDYTTESCYYLKSNLLTPYGSDVIPQGDHDYAVIYKSDGEEDEDKERLRERVSVLSASSSALVDYDRLKFNSKTADFDPNYDHLKCCGYDLKVCKRNSNQSRNTRMGHPVIGDRESQSSHLSSVNSNYEQISLGDEQQSECINVEIHDATGDVRNNCNHSTTYEHRHTRHKDVCRCTYTHDYDSDGSECKHSGENTRNICPDGHGVSDNASPDNVEKDVRGETHNVVNESVSLDNPVYGITNQQYVTRDNEMICSIIDNEYKFCNDNYVDSDNDYNDNAVI